jgi:hypothetical protein
MNKPHWQEIDPKKSYVLSGKRLKDLLRRSTDVKDLQGQTEVVENPDGSVSIGLSSQRLCYIIANGAVVPAMIPIFITVEPDPPA